MAQQRKIDVIVVGAGASGAIVAAELAQNGVRVVCMDKGPHYSDDDFQLKFDEIRYYARGAIVPHMSTDPMTWRERNGEKATLLPWVDGPLGTANPLHLPPSLGTGGGSIHWGGACWRFREAEFKMLSLIEDRLGRKALPENHTLSTGRLATTTSSLITIGSNGSSAFPAAAAISPTAAGQAIICGRRRELATIRCRRYGKGRQTSVFQTHASVSAFIRSEPPPRLLPNLSRAAPAARIAATVTAIPAM